MEGLDLEYSRLECPVCVDGVLFQRLDPEGLWYNECDHCGSHVVLLGDIRGALAGKNKTRH